MTKIKINKTNGQILSFEISGHTGYAEHGNDIVCAAISSISQSACLGILKVLKIKAKFKRDDKMGYLSLVLPKLNDNQMEKAQIVLCTMEQSLKEIMLDYAKYITMEVQNDTF